MTKKQSLLFVIFTMLLLVSAVVNIAMGTVNISPPGLFRIVFFHDMVSTNGFIVWAIRIPRTIATVLGGAYLAVAGLLLQVFFRNPIVGPFILGIFSGATLMVSIVMLTTLSLGFTVMAPFLTTLSALVGAYAAMAIVLFIAARVRNQVTLLIAGLMMGYLCHAITSVLVAFASQEKIKGFVLWQLGSFSFENIAKIYHDMYLSPLHIYLAHYRWIRDVFRTDAVMHVGKHGSLEWLPGKALGLSKECYPDLAIMYLPNHQ